LTALRKEELARLQVCHVDFENQPCPVIDLSAGITKAKKKAALWLVPSHAAELQKWIATTGKKSSDLLFGPLSPKLNSIFKRDLQAASIPETTDKGKASFRSLRNSANVYLRSMGIHPKTRQLFMRHSDIRLTCDTYDDGILTDMVELIPVLDSLSIEALHRSTTPTPATPTPAPPTTDTSTGLQIARTEI